MGRRLDRARFASSFPIAKGRQRNGDFRRDSSHHVRGAGLEHERSAAAEEKGKNAGLGDTLERLTECYGKATEKADDQEFKGAVRHTFKTDALTVTAVLGDGKCGQITYARKDGAKLAAELVEQLLQANVVPGVPWQKVNLGTTSARWMAKGEAKGVRILRMAMDLPQHLVVGDRAVEWHDMQDER